MWRYDDIAIVVAVAEKGSFIAASNMLKIPSSTLSRRVSALENQLGLRLFERNTRSLKLTQKGMERGAASSAQIQALQNAVCALTTDTDVAAGVLRVSAPLTLGNDLMTPCFTEFMQDYPQITLQLQLTNDYSALFSDNIDIALRVGPLADSELIAQKLFATEMVLCASTDFIKQYAIQGDNIMSLENAPQLNYINGPASLQAQHLTTQEDFTLKLKQAFASNHTQTMRTACIEGLGVACLPKISVQQALDSGALIRLFDDYRFSESKTIYAVYPSKQHLPEMLRVFIAHIQQAMAEI